MNPYCLGCISLYLSLSLFFLSPFLFPFFLLGYISFSKVGRIVIGVVCAIFTARRGCRIESLRIHVKKSKFLYLELLSYICLSFCLSPSLSVSSYISPSLSRSVSPYLSLSLPISLSLSIPISLCLSLSVSPYPYLSVSPCHSLFQFWSWSMR